MLRDGVEVAVPDVTCSDFGSRPGESEELITRSFTPKWGFLWQIHELAKAVCQDSERVVCVWRESHRGQPGTLGSLKGTISFSVNIFIFNLL